MLEEHWKKSIAGKLAWMEASDLNKNKIYRQGAHFISMKI